MTLVTKNAGLVRAIHEGTTPPTNIKMLWYNTSVGENKHYYYDVVSSAWVSLIQNGSGTGAIKEKVAARVSTTGAEGAVTYDNGSKTITYNANGILIIDTIALDNGDRVVWGGNGVADVKNGVYVVTDKGSVSTPAILTRASDSDTNTEINSGEVIPITDGEFNKGITFMLTTDVPASLGTSTLKYTPFSVFYTRSSATTVAVGGLSAGSMVSGPIQRTLDRILFPFQAPSFSAFSIQGQNPSLEIGQNVNGGAGSATFLWSSLNPSNIQTNSVEVIDVTGGSTVLGTGLANDGTEVLVISAISKNTPAQTHVFRIQAIATNLSNFNRLLTLTWFARRCFFINATDFITPSGNDVAISTALNALTINTEYDLVTGRVMNKNFSPTSHYIYFVWDDTFGGDQNIFTVNGLPSTSWVYKTFSYTNPFGVVRNMRIFRSLNILSTNFNVVTS